jgi:hypothetical protein
LKSQRKVFIFGAAGRVGLGLITELLRHHINIAAADLTDQSLLTQKISRLLVDTQLSTGKTNSEINIFGNTDVLNETQVTELLRKENPDIVVNYAIPFTWDATKQLPNYEKISGAGLGAFAAVQVLAPKIIAQAIAASEINAKYIVGNLPDITIPIIHGLKENCSLALPIAGSGNVGLIEASLKYQIASELQIDVKKLSLHLVAHHIHWVAPREPGYPNDAPFLLKVSYQDKDITTELGDLRQLMNRAIVNYYEPGAGFSSTTALLAVQLILSLLDEKGQENTLHVPAPNGLPGGYPVIVKNGEISLNLPGGWQQSKAEELMRQAHQRDGIEKIAKDGTIHFNTKSIAILKDEVDFDLPAIVKPSELETVAREQIDALQKAINKTRH